MILATLNLIYIILHKACSNLNAFALLALTAQNMLYSKMEIHKN